MRMLAIGMAVFAIVTTYTGYQARRRLEAKLDEVRDRLRQE